MPSTARGPFLNSLTKPSTSIPLSTSNPSNRSLTYLTDFNYRGSTVSSGCMSVETSRQDISADRPGQRGMGGDDAVFLRQGQAANARAVARIRPDAAAADGHRTARRAAPDGRPGAPMHCDNSNITGIVDRLAERGLVERRAAEGDRRVKLVALTEAGEELQQERACPPPRRAAARTRRAVGPQDLQRTPPDLISIG